MNLLLPSLRSFTRLGRSNLAGALFGPTAKKLCRRANCPVHSVRGPEHCRLPWAC
ncbi:MAG: universal stress protein [Desulfarculaceae bacterium]|nr:universal stress protein [Desulfarculaceae bacterium]